jgi:sugar phosphate isomerase/epimerase
MGWRRYGILLFELEIQNKGEIMGTSITRRDFAAACVTLPALFASRGLGAGKADITVGITVDTRPDWSGAPNFSRSIEEASSVGYHWIETFWSYVERWKDNPQGLKDTLDKLNLRLETVSNGGGGMRTDFVDPSMRKAVIEDHMKLVNFIHWFGCDHLKINIGGKHPPGDRSASYKEMSITFNEIGKRMTDLGMKFGVHAHLGSAFQTKQDIDAIMELTNPKNVYFIVDTGHVTMAGMDPVQITKTYISRIIEYHIKDVSPENKGGFKGELKGPQNTSAENRIFFELGKGGVDFPGIKKILDENNWKGWWTVELDRTGTTAKESCTIAKKYLENVMKLKV